MLIRLTLNCSKKSSTKIQNISITKHLPEKTTGTTASASDDWLRVQTNISTLTLIEKMSTQRWKNYTPFTLLMRKI